MDKAIENQEKNRGTAWKANSEKARRGKKGNRGEEEIEREKEKKWWDIGEKEKGKETREKRWIGIVEAQAKQNYVRPIHIIFFFLLYSENSCSPTAPSLYAEVGSE